MEFDAYLDEVRNQADALRAAAHAAGPDAVVPTCAGWTALRLVRHVGRVYNWVDRALDTPPDGDRPHRDDPPEGWEAALAWWDEQFATMHAKLSGLTADSRVWTFDPTGVAAFWARRMAHETAIHRLDAEHARAGSGDPAAVPGLVFPSDLAADGVDEAVTFLIPRSTEPGDRAGTVLFHAADAGRAWLVTLRPGAAPEPGPATELATDASVVGTADAVYRAVWGRPSTAVVSGDRELVATLRTP